MKKFFFILITALFFTACTTGAKIDYQSVSQIKRGISTEQEVRKMFGEPDSSQSNLAVGQKILIYRNRKSDEIKRPIAGMVGTIAGGVLGYQIGDGGGQAIATMIGASAGGAVAGNAVATREEERNLIIAIDMRTGRVSDFNYTEQANKYSPWSPSSAPSAL